MPTCYSKLKMLTRISRLFAYRPKQVPFTDWKLVRGDNVEIVSGRDKGKQGQILKVVRKRNAVVVQGANMKFQHLGM